MASYIVTGAGDASYNGLYEQAEDLYGFPSYTFQPGNLSTLRRLQYYPVSTPPGDPQNFFWILNNGVVETPVYMSEENTVLPGGTWTVAGGTAPAPTVTEWIEIPADYFANGFFIVTPTDGDDVSGDVQIQVIWNLPLYFGDEDELRVIVEVGGAVISSHDFTGGNGGIGTIWYTHRILDGEYVINATLYHKIGETWLSVGKDTCTVNLGNERVKPTITLTRPGSYPPVAGQITLIGTLVLPEGYPLTVGREIVIAIDDIYFDSISLITYMDEWYSPDFGEIHNINYWKRLDTRNLTDGMHKIAASFNDLGVPENIVTAVMYINVLNGVISYSDETPPVVNIITPDDGDNVTGAVTVEAIISDADSGVSHAILYLNALQLERIDADGTGDWLWHWNSSDNVNATYTLSITAWDKAGNSASDSISVTINNSLAESMKVLYTNLMVAANFPNWQANDKLLSIEVAAVNAADVPVNATRQYNVNVYRGTGAADYSVMDLLTPGKSSALPTPGEAVRWAMVATPRQVWGTWESNSTDLVKFATLDNGNLIVLATGPAQLLELQNAGLVQWANLATLTPVDMVAMGGKVFVASGATVYIYDQDTGDRTFTLSLDADITSVDKLLQSDDTLLVACTTTLGTGRLYEFAYDRLLIGATYTAPLTCLLLDGSTLYVGDGAGKVLRRSGASFVLEYDTAQAGGVTALGLVNNRLYAGTGDAGKVFAETSGTWSEIADFTFATINDFVTFDGWAYVFGPTANLWCEDAAGAWALQFALTNATGVNDALVITAGDTEQLYLATSRGAATAEILRLEIAPAGTLVCGPEPPDLQFKVLRSR